ncbi:MAG: glycosyltransferase family 2 protein [Phycisphaerales bacterium JB063]
MTAPKVSIIMPVYNTEKYLAEAVDSVLAQTFRDFEFIIIDDGSTDKSLELLEAYARRDKRIRLFTRPNTGYVVALNEGLGYARGEFFGRIDSDDAIEPTLYEEQLELFGKDPDLVVCGTNAVVMNEKSDVFGDFEVPVTHDAIDRHLLTGRSCIHHPGSMMRMSVVKEVGGYRSGLSPCEDYDLWLRLIEVGKAYNLPQLLLRKRMLESSAIVSGIEKRDQLMDKILADAWARRGLPGSHTPVHTRICDRAAFFKQWAWMALNKRKVNIARHYALRALRLRPLDRQVWKLVVCTLRGT